MADSYDVVVIGSGPAGYVCAIRCSQLGLKTAIVERDRLGGICLNWGCIPTKALLRSSEIWHLMHRLNEFGFSADNFKFDIGKIVERSRKVAQQLSSGVAFLMKKHKITVIAGEAKLAGKNKIAVTKDGKASEVAAKNIVLATGARARTFPGMEPDGKLIWTYREAMVPPSFPESLLVVGSGAIGIEFASFYRTLGSEVTVVEVLDRVLPVEDEEISGMAAKAFVKQGMAIKTATTVEKLEKGADSVTATLKAKDGKTETLTVDRVILAVGIVGNVENNGYEAAGIKIEKTHVVANQWGETGVPGVWAIGDLVGPPWLAHKGMHEGVIVAERIAGVKGVHPLNAANVPGCTYCWPQVASVGMTEAKAKASGRKVKVGKFPFVGN
ncbi:MAG TPA: dihydrolipoyl dehydrogenase, partial [Rhizomicrobium sp.]|nr:dihydrolipoyl dehydrogenase [Rhizomicrobium sp.]